LCSHLSKITAQDQETTDSILNVLESNTLSNIDQYEVYKALAFYHPDVIEGLNYAKNAVKMAFQLNDSIKIAVAYNQLSSQHRLLGNLVKAFEANYKALKIYEALHHDSGQADVNFQLGTNYVVDQNYPKAIQHLKKSLEIYQYLQDTIYTALTTINLGETYRLAEQYQEAAFYCEKALILNQSLQDAQIEGYALGNLGMIASAQQQYELAKTQLQKAIELLSSLDDTYSVAIYQAEIGQIYLQTDQYPQGEQYLLEAFTLAQQEGLKEQIRDFSQMLTDFYQSQKQFEQALKYQQFFQQYQDSLVNKENVQKLEQLKANYEIEKRETEIDTLATLNQRQQQEALKLVGGLVLVSVLAIFLVWNVRKRRLAYEKLSEKKALIEQRDQEKALLLRELNHRVKNNLQMISSLLNLQSNQLKDHPAMAAITAGKLRVEAMSLIHQKLYQEDHQTQIPIKEYIEELVMNLQFAYAENTQLQFEIEDLPLDIDIAIPIALIVNELVVNAFKYAYQTTEQPRLQVYLQKQQQHLQLKIQDNGIGIKEIDWEDSSSFGLTLVHSLVQQLDGKIHLVNENGSAWHILIRATKQFA